MLKLEYKILKYIYQHQNCTYQELTNKFNAPEVKNCISYLDDFIHVDNLVTDLITYNKSISSDSIFRTTRKGDEYIEHKRHEFYSFFFPYLISTLIAVSSVVAQVVPLLMQ